MCVCLLYYCGTDTNKQSKINKAKEIIEHRLNEWIERHKQTKQKQSEDERKINRIERFTFDQSIIQENKKNNKNHLT